MVLLVTFTKEHLHFSARIDFSGERISGFVSYEGLSLPSAPFSSTSPDMNIWQQRKLLGVRVNVNDFPFALWADIL